MSKWADADPDDEQLSRWADADADVDAKQMSRWDDEMMLMLILMLMLMQWPQAVIPGVTHVTAYHRTTYGHISSEHDTLKNTKKHDTLNYNIYNADTPLPK